MTDRELMQQALEALEPYSILYSHIQQIVTALRERLAQPEQALEKVAEHPDGTSTWKVTPQRREWVGLTEEQIKQAGMAVPFDGKPDWSLRFARAIEAKLKEKNA